MKFQESEAQTMLHHPPKFKKNPLNGLGEITAHTFLWTHRHTDTQTDTQTPAPHHKVLPVLSELEEQKVGEEARE